MSALACDDESLYLRIFVKPAEKLLTVDELGLCKEVLGTVVYSENGDIVLGVKL